MDIKLKAVFFILIIATIVIFIQMINYLPTYFTELDKQILSLIFIGLLMFGMIVVVFK